MTTQLLGDDPAPDERGDVSVADFDTIGPYRVLQQLGQGGMGIVHLALDARGRAVAVKVLRTHVAHDDDARARLAREVDTLARVRSQRIAPVFDADLEADQPYIVTGRPRAQASSAMSTSSASGRSCGSGVSAA